MPSNKQGVTFSLTISTTELSSWNVTRDSGASISGLKYDVGYTMMNVRMADKQLKQSRSSHGENRKAPNGN